MKLIRICRGNRKLIATGDRKELLKKMKKCIESTMRGICGNGGRQRATYIIEE